MTRRSASPCRKLTLAGLAGTNPFSITVDHFRYWIKQDAAFDWHVLKESDFQANFRLSQRKFRDVIGTDADNLHRFRRSGGKFIMWHGEADQLIFPRGTLNYYERVLEDNGGIEHVDDFARLFMAPGIAHCGGGVGPNTFDMFGALVNWVEKDVAPDRIIASRTDNGVVRLRPLCPYPKTTRWTGQASTNDAANFVCVDGHHDVRDFMVTGRGADNEGLRRHEDDDD
jgi:hypothetical protein